MFCPSISRKNRQPKTVHIATVWKLRNFNATVFSHIFRQINVLLKNFTVNHFDEKKLYSSFLVFPQCIVTVWKKEKFTLTKLFFRQINSLVTYLLKPLLSRNFFQKSSRENSRNFHTVHYMSSSFHAGKCTF